jgi:hypothetical protein
LLVKKFLTSASKNKNKNKKEKEKKRKKHGLRGCELSIEGTFFRIDEHP